MEWAINYMLKYKNIGILIEWDSKIIRTICYVHLHFVLSSIFKSLHIPYVHAYERAHSFVRPVIEQQIVFPIAK